MKTTENALTAAQDDAPRRLNRMVKIGAAATVDRPQPTRTTALDGGFTLTREVCSMAISQGMEWDGRKLVVVWSVTEDATGRIVARDHGMKRFALDALSTFRRFGRVG